MNVIKSALGFFLLIASTAIPVPAGPIIGGPCQDGTVGEYVALGDGGCTFTIFGEGHVASGFSFTLDGAPLSNDLPVILDKLLPGVAYPFFRIPIDKQIVSGETLTFSGQFNMTGRVWLYSIGLGLGSPPPPPFFVHTRDVLACLDAPFELSTCSGSSIQYDIVNGPALQLTVGETSGMIGWTSASVISGGTPAVIQSLDMGAVVPESPAVVSPEPGSMILVAMGIVAVLQRRNYGRDSC